MPGYPTVVTTDAANQDRVNQFRTYASQLPDPAQPQIDADVAAYNAHVAKLGDVTQPTASSASPSSVAAVSTSTAAPSSTSGVDWVRARVRPEYQPYVDQAVAAANKYGIDPNIYARQIFQESGFNPNAGSNEGAHGIAQFTTPTAQGYGINPWDPTQSLDAGARYMASNLKANGGDYRLALAAYNAGQGNVNRYGQGIFNAAYLKSQGWSDQDANQPSQYIAAILGSTNPTSAGQSDQSGPAAAPATAGVVSPMGYSANAASGLGGSTGNGNGVSGVLQIDSSQQPTSPKDDLKEFSAYASSLGDPGGTSSFGSNPEDASSPIDQARNQGQTGLPDFAGMASSALGSVGGLVSSMLPKPQDQGFSLPSSSGAGPQPYNDMAGASSSPLPAFGANPEDATSPIDQARNASGPTPLSDYPAALAQPLANRVSYLSSLTEPDQPNTSGKLLGGFSPEHLQAGNAEVGNAAMGTIGGLENEAGKVIRPLAGDAASNVTRMFHGSQTVAKNIDPAAFQQGIEHESSWGPMFYASPNPELANRFAPTPDQTFLAKPGGQANVRAVNVPNDLNLFDADAQPGVLAELYRRVGGNKQAVIDQLTLEGYDGIKSDNAQQVGIFPHALPKVTNALSGAPEAAARAGKVPEYGTPEYWKALKQASTPFRPERFRMPPTDEPIQAASPKPPVPPSEPPNRPPALGQLPTPGNSDARAGNILLRKFDPGVQDVIAEAAAKDPAAMEAARRGVVSDQTVQDLAQAAGTTVNKVIARWKPGDIANAETITAMKSALQSKAQEATDLAKTAVATPSAANDLNLALAVHEQNAIQAAVSGGTAELGRGLRALRASVQDAIQSGQPEQMQAVLKRMGGPEWTADLAKKLTQIDPTDAQARYDFLRNALKPTLKNDLTFLWYNAMLSGPHTVAVKTMSELLSLASSPLERGAAAVADLPLSAMRGGPRQRFFGEVPADAVGMVGGIREGVSKALYTMKNGYSMSDVLNSDYIRPRTSFSPGVERVLGSPSRILAAGVDMMSSIAQAGAINAGAYRQASIEGLKGPALAERMAELRANPTKSLAQYAKDQGIYRTFQTEPVRGSLMQRIGDIRSAEWHGIPVARIIVPFWQTPINLMKQGLERSPMGLFNPAMIKEAIAKDPKAADSLGRALLGSGVATAIALHVGAGTITGPAPTTPAEADAWRRQGKTAWSMKLGDKWVNYQKVPFIAQSLGQVASIVDSINKGQDVGSAAGQLAAVIGANMTTEPYMQGISTLMNALSNPTQFGDRMISGLATSVIPAGVRVIAQNMDPTVRQTSTVPEAMQADIPGLSQNLPPRLNAFGESQNRLTSNISPIGVSQATSDPVDAELTKYGVEPGFTGKTLRGLDLTRQEQADHQRIAGQLVKQVLTQLIADPRYKGANDLDKARALQRAITHAKDAAARQYLTQLAQSQGTDTLIRRIQQKKLAALPRAG